MANLLPWKPIWESNLLGDMSKDLENLRRDVGRLFTSEEGGTARFWPAVDISENAEGWRLHVDLPGMSQEDVELTVRDNILTIRGERKQQSKEEGENWVRTERAYGSFERDFTLPSGADEEKIQARCRNGTLEVLIPKAAEEQVQGRSIPISND